MMNYEHFEADYESGLQRKTKHFDLESAFEIPEAPESWDLDDFDDVLGNASYDFH